MGVSHRVRCCSCVLQHASNTCYAVSRPTGMMLVSLCNG
jgi:hypothetical protein